VIAYRDMGDAHRRRAFGYVNDWYTRHGYRVVMWSGDSDATFTRASAINAGVRACTADIIIQSDPDSLVVDDVLQAAVTMAGQAHGLVVPHDRYLYLSWPNTNRVYTGDRTLQSMGPDDCDTYGPHGLGNVVVFSRTTWELAHGYDERFGLWGGDDAAFAYATAAFTSPVRRLAGDVWHLWHPRLPQSVPGNPGYAEQFAILAQYRDAVSPAAVRELVRNR
jgi:hypothetical protein